MGRHCMHAVPCMQALLSSNSTGGISVNLPLSSLVVSHDVAQMYNSTRVYERCNSCTLRFGWNQSLSWLPSWYSKCVRRRATPI